MTGRPLAEAGLDGLWIRYEDGHVAPFEGLLIYYGETMLDSLQRFCDDNNCTIFTDESAARRGYL